MAEPTTVTTAVAAAAITTGTLTVAGSLFGIPADAILASVMGAGLAMGRSRKVDPTGQSLAAAIGVFVTSLFAAVVLGPAIGFVANMASVKFLSFDVPAAVLRPVLCFVVALGSQQWLPALLGRVTTEIGRVAPDKGKQ
jgi:type IV secretory pathway TrbD component